MGSLRLTYREDDEPNKQGELDVIVEAQGYRAAGSTYVAASSLEAFAAALKKYPLRAEGALFEVLELSIRVTPRGSRGHMLVVSTVECNFGRSGLFQKATLQLDTDYGTVEAFATDVVAAARRGSGEALL